MRGRTMARFSKRLSLVSRGVAEKRASFVNGGLPLRSKAGGF
jgi:hypothetical protein